MVKKQTLLSSILLLLLSLTFLVASTYAWFASIRMLSDFEADVGSLDSSIEVEYWNSLSASEIKWETVPNSGAQGQVYISLGRLTDMGQVPADSELYLKIKGIDSSEAVYVYDITIASIEVNVYYQNGQNFVKVVGDDNVDTIDYFAESQSQMCLEHNASVKQTDELAPSVVFTLPLDTAEQLTFSGQSFTGGEFIAQDEYLYVKLALRQAELADIVRRIPASYLPYKLELVLHTAVEIRTAD